MGLTENKLTSGWGTCIKHMWPKFPGTKKLCNNRSPKENLLQQIGLLEKRSMIITNETAHFLWSSNDLIYLSPSSLKVEAVKVPSKAAKIWCLSGYLFDGTYKLSGWMMSRHGLPWESRDVGKSRRRPTNHCCVEESFVEIEVSVRELIVKNLTYFQSPP